ncbi:hypothetical protein [Streptomyces pini]|uniref:Uncharacterized protein n=1 Tax=Streptomyces pini TaxID=1520580 RepID=A0A1I4BZ93_9ACTN|nr:hypothetical protein [Streptomyces pini]SFK73720.1 hypothetical protein SAMN05192584_108185 [Streptomyces pini]
MAKEIKHTAGGKHMTLDELAAFVQDAMRTGAAGHEPVAATVTFGGKLRTVTVEVDVRADRLSKD